MKLTSPRALLALSALGLIAASGTSSAQFTLINPTTLNGSFESPTVTKVASGFDSTPNITNWGNTNTNYTGGVGAYTDTGVQNDPSQAQQGAQFTFFKPGEGGAFNLTSYVIQAGDQFSLTWWGGATGNGGNQQVRLFSSTNGTYATAATLFSTLGNATYNLSTFTNPPVYVQYTATYTAVAGDAGKTIGVSVFNSGTSYIAEDNFSLTVTSVPEPSTYLLGIAAIGLCVYRARRRKIAA